MNLFQSFYFLIILNPAFTSSIINNYNDIFDNSTTPGSESSSESSNDDFILHFNNDSSNTASNVSLKHGLPMNLRELYQYAYEKSFNKNNAIIITVILLSIALIGSVSNLLVVIVFTLRDDCMEMDGHAKRASSTRKDCRSHNPNQTDLQIESQQQQQQQQQPIKFKNKNKTKNSTKSTKPIYLLIKYLALVDFLTCSVIIPGTVYEMWFLSKSNELLCRSFELIRTTGVVLSNFLVILISFERFMLLCKPFSFYKFKNVLFKRLLILTTMLSLFIGSVAMLQVSVYQYDDRNKVVLTNLCFQSRVTLSFEFAGNVNMAFIYMFLFGACLVGFLYIFIFRSAFKLNQKRADRMRMNEKMFMNADRYSSGKFKRSYIRWSSEPASSVKKTSGSIEISQNDFKIESFKAKKESKFNLRGKFGLYKNSLTIFKSNMRIAFMIFFVTLSYYVSVLPWCLIKNGLIKYNLFIYYTFLLNNSLNPVIYGFFNPNFRRYCFEILSSVFNCKTRVNLKEIVKKKKKSEQTI